LCRRFDSAPGHQEFVIRSKTPPSGGVFVCAIHIPDISPSPWPRPGEWLAYLLAAPSSDLSSVTLRALMSALAEMGKIADRRNIPSVLTGLLLIKRSP
jgi:hypothetical protein